MARSIDRAMERIFDIQQRARSSKSALRARWPMIVLATPKGWTGPAMLDGHRIEGTFRSHQVPLMNPATNPDQLRMLDAWMRSYRPEELFDERGRCVESWRSWLRRATAAWVPILRRMAAASCATCGCPTSATYAVGVSIHGATEAEDTRVLGRFLRDVVKLNQDADETFAFSDRTRPSRIDSMPSSKTTARQWEAQMEPDDQWLAADGSVLEVLSEHQCQGWLEGYLLTGRHGLFNTYEAFAHIVDSMFNQHAKWLKVTRGLPWRRRSRH